MTIFVLSLCMSLFSGFSGADEAADCNPDKGGCIKRIRDREILFSLGPKPVRSMEELDVSLLITPRLSAPDELVVDLSMPGMYMGKNQVLLRRNLEGGYSGKGVIPRCGSGRRLWRATVDIPGTGKVGFTFHVHR